MSIRHQILVPNFKTMPKFRLSGPLDQNSGLSGFMISKAGTVTIVIVYVILLLSYPRFGIVDDHRVATTTRLGESPHFPLNVSTVDGRFRTG